MMGLQAWEKLLEQLADVPTPAGSTPKEIEDRVRRAERREQ
jgi:hypothetical protein